MKLYLALFLIIANTMIFSVSDTTNDSIEKVIRDINLLFDIESENFEIIDIENLNITIETMTASIYLLAGLEEALAGVYNYESFAISLFKSYLESISDILGFVEKPFNKDEIVSIIKEENNPFPLLGFSPDIIYILKREFLYLTIGYENEQISLISLNSKYFLDHFK